MIINEARVAAALPGYELGAQLGQGAFGLVLAGRHRELHRDVAIKILPARPDGTAENSLAEARLLAALDHPHIVRVYDAVADGDLHLIVMELLGGGTLTRRRAHMPPEAACAVGLAVAAALGYAHGQGVLHRDIKPDNMLFDTAGLLKVTDFGIAKLVEGSAAAASAVVGTPRYMAPEQLLAGRLSPATDLYALGILLYELLAGGPPFDPALPAPALAHHHLKVLPPPPAGVPTPLADVVTRALAKDPAARQPSADVFAVDLAHAAADVFGPGWIARAGIQLRLDDEIRAAADQPSVPTQPAAASRKLLTALPAGNQPLAGAGGGKPDTPGRGRPWPRRQRLIVAAVAVLLVVVAATVGVVTSTWGGDPSTTHVVEGTDTPLPASSAPTPLPASSAPTPLPASSAPTPLPAPRVLGSLLTGHTGVWSVAFSPDGRTLASAGDDGAVRLWDVTDPANPSPLGEPSISSANRVEEVAFSPDGRTLASAGDDTVRLWDVTDRAKPRPLGEPLTGHVGSMYTVAFSLDGTLLAGAGGEQAMVLWDVSDRTAPRLLTSHVGWSASVEFSPDRKTLASAYNQTVQLWDVSDRTAPGTLGAPLTSHTGWVYSVAFSPDGRTLAASGDDDVVQLWDVTDPSVPSVLGDPLSGHTNTVVSVAFSPDGRILASASDDHTVRLWDVTDRAKPRPLGEPLTGHTDNVLSVAFSPDGRTLAASGWDGTVRLWDLG